MRTEQTLLDNFEDARFALLMDEYMRAEGRRLAELNRTLQADPSAAVPEKTFENCLVTINRSFREKQRKKASFRRKKLLKNLPLAVVIAAALFVTAMAAVPQFRVGVLNLIKSETSSAITWTIGDKPDKNPTGRMLIHVPDGFEMTDHSIADSHEYARYENTANPEQSFQISIYSGTNGSYSISNENYTKHETIKINGEDAEVFVNDTMVWMMWLDPQVPYIGSLDSVNMPEETMIEIAKTARFIADDG